MIEHDFIARFGAIYEHSPWVAERACAEIGLGDDIECIAEVMSEVVDNASAERQLALLRAHPDLAGKARLAGELTEASASEQASAGLDQCSAEELERFRRLNVAYRDKFGFPFIMAVRDADRAEILDAFERRLANDAAIEFETALAEVHKIARLRLAAIEAGP